MVEPGGVTHGSPVQQSLVDVQVLPFCTHWAPHKNSGTAASPVKAGFARQFKPQQSALVAHGLPARVPPSASAPVPASALRCAAIVQRGMPSVSR